MAVEIPLKMEIALYVGDLKCRLASVDAWKRAAIDPEYETALHFAEMALISVENLEDEKGRHHPWPLVFKSSGKRSISSGPRREVKARMARSPSRSFYRNSRAVAH